MHNFQSLHLFTRNNPIKELCPIYKAECPPPFRLRAGQNLDAEFVGPGKQAVRLRTARRQLARHCVGRLRFSRGRSSGFSGRDGVGARVRGGHDSQWAAADDGGKRGDEGDGCETHIRLDFALLNWQSLAVVRRTVEVDVFSAAI
jgi:hypothetical protein